MKGFISAVQQESLGALAGIQKGEKLCTVNGVMPKDIIELSFLLAESTVELLIEDSAGTTRKVIINKELDKDLGLEFSSAVFNQVCCCYNKCTFCFVDQMMPNLRKSLYVRDDDYRLSFLYGGFVTLTNMDDSDYERIIKNHLSPLYVSVHATNPSVRVAMMKNKHAGDILKNIKRLTDAGIEIHTQVVLCPGFNDGNVLKETFNDLLKFYPMVKTLAVVPVGLTKNRKHLPLLRLFTSDEAKQVVSAVEKWQKECRTKFNKSFIYLGDEFYVNAKMELPPTEHYDGFPQLENGIGLSRNFIDEWNKIKVKTTADFTGKGAVIPVGESAAKILEPFIAGFNNKYRTNHQLLPVVNNFFGDSINVTGLLTGRDILQTLKDKGFMHEVVILPETVLNSDRLFLDDMSLTEFKKQCGRTVSIAKNAVDLKKLLCK
jgi:putative radical SAM enzyme (TIGR03279 family)